MNSQPSAQTPTLEDFARRVGQARQAGDIPGAERHCRAIAAFWPERPAGYVNLLGMSMVRPAGHGSADTERLVRQARTLAGAEERVLRNLAVAATHAGLEDDAGRLLLRILVSAPGDARMWRVLAHRREPSGRTQLAAVLLNPGDLDTLRSCVVRRAADEDWPAVLSAIRYAHDVDIADAVDLVEFQNQALLALDRLDEALSGAQALAEKHPDSARTWLRVGMLLRSTDRAEQARHALVRSAVLTPEGFGPYAALGRLELAEKYPDDALTVLERARAVAGGGHHPGVEHNRAAALGALRQGEKARPILRRILVMSPGDAGSVLNLATAEQYALDLDAAGRWIERALLMPGSQVDALFNGALIARYSGDIRTARTRLKAVLDCDPEHDLAHFTLANLELQDGDRRTGARAFLERFRVPGFSAARQLWPAPSLAKPVWDLSPAPDARVFVWGEQGIGDEVWFTQYLHAIRDRVGSVSVELSAKLVPLMRRTFPWATIVARGTAEAEAAAASADLQLPIGNLVVLCEDIPPASGYLTPNEDLVAAFRQRYQGRFPGKRLIGISWRSVKPAALTRSFEAPLRHWGPIFGLPDTQLISLQYNPEGEDFRAAAAAFGAAPYADPKVNTVDDIGALAAQIAALDAVVSIANSTVALAHGVGKPAYVPLRGLQDDFRYPRQSDRSFWLPQVQFSWAPQPDRWEVALGDLAARIARDRPGG